MLQLACPREHLALRILTVAFILQCLGEGLTIFRYGSALTSTLWHEVGLSDTLAWQIDRAGYALCVILAGAWGLWKRQSWALGVCASWFAFLTAHEYYQAGSFGAAYSPFAHALRFATPLALGLLVRRQEGEGHGAALGVLRLATASVFAAHGLEAWQFNPEFIDFIIRVTRTYVSLAVNEQEARYLLLLIGAQDVALAFSVLVSPRRPLLYYMSVWGFLTATVRVLFSPAYGLPLMLVRMTNGGAPLALALWSKHKKAV